MQSKRKLASLATLVCLILPALFVVISTGSVSAATPIYVDAATGNDAWDGQAPVWDGVHGPKQTIAAGISVVDASGTVQIAAGTYNEAVTVNKSLTMQGAGPAVTVITTIGATPAITITTNDVTIRDLTITNSSNLIEGILVSVSGGATSGLTVENVHFTNINNGAANAYGIRIGNSSPGASFSGLIVRSCRFSGINPGSLPSTRQIGILAASYLNLHDFYIGSCQFSYLMTGVYLYRSNVDGVTLINNEFGPFEQANYTGAPGGIYVGDSQPSFPTTYQNITVTGNTFHEYHRGINIWNYADGTIIGRVDISNNTFTNSIASAGVMITARWVSGGTASTMEGPIFINNNTFTQDQPVNDYDGVAMIDLRAGIESPTSQINVADNEITFNNPAFGTSIYGMKFRGPFTNVNISGNTMNGNLVGGASANMPPTSGIVFGSKDVDPGYGSISSNAEINVSGNSIQKFVHGVAVYDFDNNVYGALPVGAGLNINYDSIICNSEYGVISGSGEVTNAVNTWWGCNDGPSGVGSGSGEEVSSNVSYDPWLVLNISAEPPDILADGVSTSTITADMTDNSNGVDSGGYVPNGTEIVFTTNKGSIGSLTTTKTTTNGIATAVFTSDITPGAAAIFAKAPTCYECANATNYQGETYAVSVGVNTVPVTGTATATPGASPATTWSWSWPLPPEMSVQYVSVKPQQSYANQPVTVLTNVVNTGDEGGNFNVVLKINGRVEQTRMVGVGPQGTQPVKFTVTKAQPGTYIVDIAGQKASFTVLGHGGTARAPLNAGLIAIVIMAVLVLATAVVLVLTFR